MSSGGGAVTGGGAAAPGGNHGHPAHRPTQHNHHHHHLHHLPGRYYATERRRQHGYPSFSIMKWFRRSKHCGDDADAAWFRDDLMRLRQAYVEHEPDYAAVTPIAARHRGPAATWSRWSGSTTTVYSFAYVDGEHVDEGRPQPDRAAGHRGDRDDGDEEVDGEVVYIDAATLPVARRRCGPRRCSPTPPPPPPSTASSSSAASAKPSAATTGRTAPSAAGTMSSTYRRRYNKKAAPPPPPPLGVVGAASAQQQQKTSTAQRRTATVGRKKYRAPQPPTQPVDAKPQTDRRPVRVHRRKKGPAPKPPVQQQQQQQQKQQQQLQQQELRTRPAADGVQPPTRPRTETDRSGSNVRRKISQYERERLMQRVDKIEKHFLQPKDDAAITAAAAAAESPGLPWAASATRGFASPAAMYSAMAATNLSELDKRAAEICRLRNGQQAAAAAARRPNAVADDHKNAVADDHKNAITDDHKNAIVAAVMRKSHPATTAAADEAKRPDETRRAPDEAAADDLRLVRRKRLAFFQQQAAGGEKRQTVHGDDASMVATAAATAEAEAAKTTVTVATSAKTVAAGKTLGRAAKKSSAGTQTAGSVVEAKTLPRAAVTRGPGPTSESINLPPEDNNCYQQLMAMEMQSDLVLHNGPFECAVCLCTYDNNGVVLRDCLHVFCRPCLQMTVAHSNAEQVECPYIDEKYSCTGVLQHREIKKILDSDEEYERFLQRSVDRARQLLAKEGNGASFQCRRPDCTGWCMIYDKHHVLEFKCPVCGTVTCVQCGSIHSQQEGCKKNNDISNSDGSLQDTLEDLIDRGDAMLCPGCNTVLSKQQGCDWIKCAVCFLEICWATKGPRWGPKGKGDTTGGCKCGIPPGRKCHTDCKYCH